MSSFSLWRNGWIFRLLRTLGVVRGDGTDAVRVAAMAAVLGLAPLVVAVPLTGTVDPTVAGPLVFVRWLVAMPLVLVSSELIDERIRWVLDHLRRAEVVPTERLADLEAVERRIQRLNGSPWTLLIIVLIVVAGTVAPSVGAALPDDPAVAYHRFVGLPLARAILAGWVVRWLSWSLMVHLLLRLDPILSPAHPDRRAGLDELERPLVGVGAAAFGLGCLVATAVWSEMTFSFADLRQFSGLLVLWIVLVVVIAALPGLPLSWTLARARRRGLWGYGALAQRHNLAFERRWIEGGADDPLGTPDMSSLADLQSAYATLHEIRFFPLTREDVLIVVTPALLPVVALLFTVLPGEELAKILLGFLA